MIWYIAETVKPYSVAPPSRVSFPLSAFFFSLSLDTKGAPGSIQNCGLSFFLRRGRETTEPETRRAPSTTGSLYRHNGCERIGAETRRAESSRAEPTHNVLCIRRRLHSVHTPFRAPLVHSATDRARLSPRLFQACAPRAHITRYLCLSVFVVRAIAYR